MDEHVQTLIIGAGQAGLAISSCLAQRGCEHLVLEQADIPGSAWRDDRWDSFALNSPNWASRLPGAADRGVDPHAFLERAGIVDYLARYARAHAGPVRYGVRVASVEAAPGDQGYRVVTSGGAYRAANVVVATGLYQKPKIPAAAAHLPPGIVQISSGQYRNPGALPPGAVLVVGSAQSGCQIAEELYLSGRVVYLCTSTAARAPRRYRGRDIFAWLDLSGFMDQTQDRLPNPQARFAPNPHLSGTNGGHDINLHQFAADGVRLLGRFRDARDGKICLAPDLHANLSASDTGEQRIVDMFDAYIARERLDAPEEHLRQLRAGFAAPIMEELDCAQAGITSVIWAIGYDYDFSLVKLPVFDDMGYPILQGGATRYTGLYFMGLPWLTRRKSGLLLGVGDDAARVADAIAARPQA